MFKIDYEYESPYGTFRDAIVMETEGQLTPEQIEAEKQRRIDNWLASVAPTPAQE